MSLSLLNRSRVKRYSLEVAASSRKLASKQPRFTRVSAAWYQVIEADLRACICNRIQRLPSKGRTLS